MRKVCLNITSTLSLQASVITILTIVNHNYRRDRMLSPLPLVRRISIILLPTNKQWLNQEKIVYRTVQHWSEKSMTSRQNCFETSDWQIFCVAASGVKNTQTLSQPTSSSGSMMLSWRSMLGLPPTKSPGLMVVSMLNLKQGPLPIALGNWSP